ncbi:hypothetical protein [Taibaiella soli]|uniref:Uncharacterized protein n=1 Tax=Taibaiella soli TaxID=1649169 RepID=A0A2W2BC41_9BACT|nr:hypothetical protein [Taibaiella soli]PZF71236.1 hypothetical protein DN068_18220 [Taibaiella soli]
MDENQANILRESNKIISKLQLLAGFFEDDIIYKIFLRSQVIQKLFENNPELDINKLDLFHLQFTVTVIELLKKIKRTNEQNVSVLYDEIRLNKELIDTLSISVLSELDFNEDKQRQAIKLGISLRKLYQVLSANSREYPFSNNLETFSEYAADYFHAIPPERLSALIQYKPDQVYTHPHATIHRKLMGLLCKYDFKVVFLNGLKAGNLFAEFYKIQDTDRYFLFFPSRGLFLLTDISQFADLDFPNEVSKKAKIVQELQHKNSALEMQAGIIKTSVPKEIQKLLAEYLEKIEDVNFLQNLSNVDVQANILKTMLNTDLM